MSVVLALLAAILLLAPILSGVPDEPFYSSVFCALTLAAALVGLWKARNSRLPADGSKSAGTKAEIALAALLVIALLSLLLRLTLDRSIAYLDPMLRGWLILGTEIALFVLCRRAAQAGRLPLYVLALAAVLASAIVGEVGVTEHFTHARQGQAVWRVFADSTPDFTAGYLAMMLPPTLALFLGIPWQRQKSRLIGFVLSFLLLVIVAYQVMTLFWTSSRFALVSLTVGLLVFSGALWWARRRGLTLEPSSWQRMAAGALAVLLAAAALGIMLIGHHSSGGGVVSRLQQTSLSDNSTLFRLYTWRGAARMAAANPLLGTGIGSWVELYPRYALTGFTRLAHDSYLQMADECGLPGLIALLAALGFVGAAGWRGLASEKALTPVASDRPFPNSGRGLGTGQDFLSIIAPPDDRLLLAGLLGGLAAAVVQNLIDSDWYVFFLGVTFWALAGLATGKAEPAADLAAANTRWRPAVRSLVGALCALLLVYAVTQSVASWDARGAAGAIGSLSPDSAGEAEQDLADARMWDPLNAKYAAMLGYDVEYKMEGRLLDAISMLRTAVRLEPSSDNFHMLALALEAAHQGPAAIAALQRGLRCDPVSDVSFTIRLNLSQLLPPPQSTAYCRQLADVENSPVGRVRAIGNIMPYQFPIADTCVGDADDAAQDAVSAETRYAQAETDLEAYADQNGSMNIQRQVLMGDRPNPALDRQMQQLYAHVMSRRIALAPPAARPALAARAARYQQKYAALVSAASQSGTV